MCEVVVLMGLFDLVDATDLPALLASLDSVALIGVLGSRDVIEFPASSALAALIGLFALVDVTALIVLLALVASTALIALVAFVALVPLDELVALIAARRGAFMYQYRGRSERVMWHAGMQKPTATNTQHARRHRRSRFCGHRALPGTASSVAFDLDGPSPTAGGHFIAIIDGAVKTLCMHYI